MTQEKHATWHNIKNFGPQPWSDEMKQNLLNACEHTIVITSAGGNHIYLALDEEEASFSKRIATKGCLLIDCSDHTAEEIYKILETHYKKATGTRIITAVTTVEPGEDENEGYITLVPAECDDAFSS